VVRFAPEASTFSGNQLDVLPTAGEPLHAKEIAKSVLESGRTRLGGKTPEQEVGETFSRSDAISWAPAEHLPATEGFGGSGSCSAPPR
jgi:hypothetical protein